MKSYKKGFPDKRKPGCLQLCQLHDTLTFASDTKILPQAVLLGPSEKNAFVIANNSNHDTNQHWLLNSDFGPYSCAKIYTFQLHPTSVLIINRKI